MSGKLYSRLFLAYHAMSVVADQHGSPAFMESFRTYVLKNHIPDLFTGPQPAFRFDSSKENVLIQLADFVAGSIARVFVHGKDDDERILPALRKHQIAIEGWPPRRYLFNLAVTDESRSADDALIADRNMAAAIDFLNRHERDADDDVRAQSAALTFLIYHLQHGNPARLVQTGELIQAVKAQTGRSMGEQPFRNRVIAKLRCEDPDLRRREGRLQARRIGRRRGGVRRGDATPNRAPARPIGAREEYDEADHEWPRGYS
jgi:hypothetical protein